MSRPLGGYIGYDAEPATPAAPGIWTLREAEFYQRKAQWPVVFAPSDITGLQLWLDASDDQTLYDATTGGSLVAADGSVARWEDKSGNDRHATQGTAGARPLRKASVQNGLDGLRFDGSDDFLAVPSSTATFKFLHSQDSSVFVVAKSGTSADPGVQTSLLATYNSSGNEVGYMLRAVDSNPPNDDFRLTVGTGGGGGTLAVDTSTGTDSFTSNEYNIVSVITKPTEAVAADRSSVSINGGSSVANNAEATSVSTSNSQADLTLGIAPVLNVLPLDGDICEILIYNSALSDTDREAVENYLLGKWGIS